MSHYVFIASASACKANKLLPHPALPPSHLPLSLPSSLLPFTQGRVSHYVFVASAGAYKANSMEPMHVEGDARKSSAGHVEVEKYLQDQGLPYTVFQPLYIYGPLTAKDCEQWFIDRIIRDRPVPIPAPGE